MLRFFSAAPFAALQVGVMLIAAVLWIDKLRAERRNRLVRNLQSVLEEEDVRRTGEKTFKRAA